MFFNDVKIALRNVMRHKSYSIINILGLALGIACCLIILSFIYYNLGYENIHENKSEIYRVVTNLEMGDVSRRLASTMPPLAEYIGDEVPEMAGVARFFYDDVVSIEYNGCEFEESNFWFADADVFDIFTLPLIKGNKSTALNDPFTIVITKSMAKKYFGEHDPIGCELKYRGEHSFTVTGILRDFQGPTQLKTEFLASMSSMENIDSAKMKSWVNLGSIYTYLHIPNAGDTDAIEARLNNMLPKYAGEQVAAVLSFELQPFESIYLHSNRIGELAPKGNISYLYILFALAGAILIIACINFINLSTARYSHRMKEVGIKKVLGAPVWHIARQFTGESVIYVFLALLFGLGISELSLSWATRFFSSEFNMIYQNNYIMWLYILLSIVLIGIIAGIYPALFLARRKPHDALQGEHSYSAGAVMRKVLVVFQFAVTIILFTGAFVIYSQLDYINNADLGFDDEDVMLIPAEGIGPHLETLRTELAKIPGVVYVSGSESFPSTGRIVRSGLTVEGKDKDENVVLQRICADYNYLKVLDLPLIEGRDFSREIASDERCAAIVNEAAVKKLGWRQPIGKKLYIGEEDGDVLSVIGVVGDFHLKPMQEEIEPAYIRINDKECFTLALKYNRQNGQEILSRVKEVWAGVIPGKAFDYSMLKGNFERFYKKENQQGEVIIMFAVLAVVVACLGLTGLVAFSGEKRSKEIGIRKVMGAGRRDILRLLLGSLLKLIVIANVIAWPAAYYFMDKWLANFAYHIALGWELFFFAGSAALIVAFVVMSLQAVRIAAANPVDALKYE